MALRAVPDHPKFAELKILLGRPKFFVLGCLEAMWHFTGRFCPAGDIGKYSDAAIEGWVEWDGTPGALITALVQARWVDSDETYRLIVHDWDQCADVLVHTTLARQCQRFANGSVPECGRLNQRERDRFNAWLDREGLAPRTPGRPAKKQPESSQNSDSLSGSTAKIPKPEPAPAPAPAPDPAPAPEPEKICAAASATPKVSSPAEVAPALWEGQPLTLETVRGEKWIVPAAACLRWASAFPGVDVLAELLKMREWLEANPRHRKTSSGMMRFIVSWLTRAQNSSRPGPRSYPQAQRPATDTPQTAWSEASIAAREAQRAEEERESYAMWCGMGEDFKRKNPWWGRPIAEMEVCDAK